MECGSNVENVKTAMASFCRMLERKTLSNLVHVSPINGCVAIKPRFHIRLKCCQSGLSDCQGITLVPVLGMTEDLELDGLSKFEKQQGSALQWVG